MPRKSDAPLRVAIYSRVSTDHQTTENQERELQAIAERIGWTVVKVYRDQGVSGAKSRQDRPAFDALCKDASRRQFDLIAAWSVDRLGRSLQDLVGFLTEIHALGVNLFLHQQGVDTTTPAGKPLFQMMGVFAEFERAMDPRARQGRSAARQGPREGAREALDAAREGRGHQGGSAGRKRGDYQAGQAPRRGRGDGSADQGGADGLTTSRIGKPLLRPRSIHWQA
jgi:DNA invertase Pin-like site-specific DNA recombinase